jgi:hypothetical protein
MKKRSFVTGIAIGVVCTFVFFTVVDLFRTPQNYRVWSTDDHQVILKSEDGNFVALELENVPDISCFETGALITLNHRP